MKYKILGSSGFIGKNLLQKIPNAEGFSLRDENWRSQISNAEVIVNLVGKAHDHKGTATEQDFRYANVELTKQIFNEFFKSKATLLIHISSIASLEEFASLHPLNDEDLNNPISNYGKTKRGRVMAIKAKTTPRKKNNHS